MQETIYVVRDANHARRAGFAGRRHPHDPHATVWWPGCGEATIMVMRWPRVVVISSSFMDMTSRDWDALEQGIERLRTGQQVFGDKAVWMEF